VTGAPLQQLSSALAATEDLVAGVETEQWSAPTPCAGWDVADLVRHVVNGNHLFARALSGQPADPPAGSMTPTDALLAAYREGADELLVAFSQPGALDKTVTVPFGTVPGQVALHLRITELLVHGWDLAKATGAPGRFPEDVAEAELAFSAPLLGRIPPDRNPFAPPQAVPDDAPAIDRLAGLLGRGVGSES